jgi:hypothetical protein
MRWGAWPLYRDTPRPLGLHFLVRTEGKAECAHYVAGCYRGSCAHSDYGPAENRLPGDECRCVEARRYIKLKFDQP